MIPLIPLALQCAPALARWLFGDGAKGAAITQAVDAAATAITGTADPVAQVQALTDPAKAEMFQVELYKLVAQAEAAQRADDLADLQAVLADVANARMQTITLAASHSALAWGAPIMSMIVIVTFGLMCTLVLARQIPAGSENLASILLGALSSMAAAVVSYWVGSSAGSHGKDVTIAEQSRNLGKNAAPMPARPTL